MSSSSITNVPNNVDLMSLSERRMAYLEHRQSVLAGNIANANTPHYKVKDVGTFQGVLNTANNMALTRTNPKHLSGNTTSTRSHITGSRSSIDGNHVVLEDQLAKIADNNDQQRFASSAFGRYMGLYSMALGGGN